MRPVTALLILQLKVSSHGFLVEKFPSDFVLVIPSKYQQRFCSIGNWFLKHFITSQYFTTITKTWQKLYLSWRRLKARKQEKLRPWHKVPDRWRWGQGCCFWGPLLGRPRRWRRGQSSRRRTRSAVTNNGRTRLSNEASYVVPSSSSIPKDDQKKKTRQSSPQWRIWLECEIFYVRQ